MLHRVLELAGLTIRVSGPLLIGWMNPTKSKLRYLEAMPEQLIGVTRSVNIKFVIKGLEGGLGSRSLVWFLPRFPAPILVRFLAMLSMCNLGPQLPASLNPAKNPRTREEKQYKLTHLRRRVRESKLGHVGGR